MKKSVLDLDLPNLGLGTAQLGNLFRVTSDFESEETLESAWSEGISYFDTAPHYGLGLSERRVGNFLKDKPREDFLISTKVGRLLVPRQNQNDALDEEGFSVPADFSRRWDFSRDGILRSVEESLARTGLDHFDILYLHDPENHMRQAMEEGVATLIDLRSQGVVSAVGAGMNYAEPLTRLIQNCDIDLVMCAGRFTLVDSSALSELLPAAEKAGVGVVAAGIYNSGLLSTPIPPENATFNYEQASDALISRAREIAEVCEKHGVTLPAAALAYVQNHPAVVSVVFGARGAKQVNENIQNSMIEIPDSLWEELWARELVRKY